MKTDDDEAAAVVGGGGGGAWLLEVGTAGVVEELGTVEDEGSRNSPAEAARPLLVGAARGVVLPSWTK